MTSFMLLSVIALLTLPASSLGATEGLSAEERGQFYNSNNQGGVVMLTENDSDYVIESNGLPDHDIEQVNPNTASSQNFRYTFDKEIEFACTPGNVPKGVIAITKTGVAIFNPLTSADLNAVEGDQAEKFDRCNGHSDGNGVYHYHQSPGSNNCGETYTAEYDQFIGVALDGFPIYGPHASDKGTEPLTSDDLDICHGRMVDGKYRYHLTFDFPYVLGCYWGAGAGNRVSYVCDSQVGTDLTEWGYLCSNVDQRNVPATVCDSYPGTVEVTTDGDGGDSNTAAPTQAPTTAAPTTKRPGKGRGGKRTRQNKPNPVREAYLKRWLRQLLEEAK